MQTTRLDGNIDPLRKIAVIVVAFWGEWLSKIVFFVFFHIVF